MQSSNSLLPIKSTTEQLLHVCHFVVALVTFEEPSGDHGMSEDSREQFHVNTKGQCYNEAVQFSPASRGGLVHHELGLFFWLPSLPLYLHYKH